VIVAELLLITKSCMLDIVAAVFDSVVPEFAITFTVSFTSQVEPLFSRARRQFSVPVLPTAGAVQVPPPAS
jgi:hypothetical protein